MIKLASLWRKEIWRGSLFDSIEESIGQGGNMGLRDVADRASRRKAQEKAEEARKLREQNSREYIEGVAKEVALRLLKLCEDAAHEGKYQIKRCLLQEWFAGSPVSVAREEPLRGPILGFFLGNYVRRVVRVPVERERIYRRYLEVELMKGGVSIEYFRAPYSDGCTNYYCEKAEWMRLRW